jgi:transcriptional regulator with XRE-family HTH domain
MTNSTTLADRIRARLSATGKSASAVSMEAGLGRSAIRDILNGKAGHPRLDTLMKLAGPLGCSVAFLTGHEDQAGTSSGALSGFAQTLGVQMLSVRAVLKVGVYADSLATLWENSGAFQDLHTIAVPTGIVGEVQLYRLGDDSLAGGGLLKDDLLIVEQTTAGVADILKPGTLVVVERALHGMPQGPFEYSARIVSVRKGAVSLTTAPRADEARSVLIDQNSFEDGDEADPERLGLLPPASGSVRIIGVGRQVIRDLK